jgi:hypothetical protein
MHGSKTKIKKFGNATFFVGINGFLYRGGIVKKHMFFYGFFMFLFLTACSSSIKEPLKAPELTGEELNTFLDSSFRYGPVEHAETIREVFYSGNQDDVYEVGQPKNMGKKKGEAYYAIIINKKDTLPNDYYTAAVFEFDSSGRFLDYVEQNINKAIKRYDGVWEKNPILLPIFPNGYFATIAEEWKIQEQKLAEEKATEDKKAAEELAASLTSEGWPKDSIYTSELILREGIMDMKGYTVGQLFYTGNRAEGITVNKLKNIVGAQTLTITIVNQETKYTSKINLYLDFDKNSNLTLLKSIENLGGDGTKTVADAFNEKYLTLTMILPYLINEGNLGETY